MADAKVFTINASDFENRARLMQRRRKRAEELRHTSNVKLAREAGVTTLDEYEKFEEDVAALGKPEYCSRRAEEEIPMSELASYKPLE